MPQQLPLKFISINIIAAILGRSFDFITQAFKAAPLLHSLAVFE